MKKLLLATAMLGFAPAFGADMPVTEPVGSMVVGEASLGVVVDATVMLRDRAATSARS